MESPSKSNKCKRNVFVIEQKIVIFAKLDKGETSLSLVIIILLKQ